MRERSNKGNIKSQARTHQYEEGIIEKHAKAGNKEINAERELLGDRIKTLQGQFVDIRHYEGLCGANSFVIIEQREFRIANIGSEVVCALAQVRGNNFNKAIMVVFPLQ